MHANNSSNSFFIPQLFSFNNPSFGSHNPLMLEPQRFSLVRSSPAPPSFVPESWDGLFPPSPPQTVHDVNYRAEDTMPSHSFEAEGISPASFPMISPTPRVAPSDMGGSAAPMANHKRGVKRKASDVDVLSGKALVDTYSKRSYTLREKGRELAQLTGAYVFIFTARPESVEHGYHRLYTSENFESAQCAPLKSLADALSDIKAEFDPLPKSHPRAERDPTRSSAPDAEADVMNFLTDEKKRVDAYSKRSKTLRERGIELAKLTGAYVMLFTARPESVELGYHRLFSSENLEIAEFASIRRLAGLASDIRTALSSIPKSHPRSVRPQKDNHRKSSVLGVELIRVVSEFLPAHPPPIPSAAEDIPPTLDLEVVLSAEPDAAAPLSRVGRSPAGACRKPHEIPNPIAGPTVTNIGADEEIIRSPVIPSKTQLSVHETSIFSIVMLLESPSKEIYVPALAAVKAFVTSGVGWQPPSVIPLLARLLRKSIRSPSEVDVACQIALILFYMAHDGRFCDDMMEAGVLPPLSSLVSLPVGTEVLLAVTRIMRRCRTRIWSVEMLSHYFSPPVLRPLVMLLSSPPTQVRVAAADALRNITWLLPASSAISTRLTQEGVLRQLCLLAPRCRNLAELGIVLSAICQIVRLFYGECVKLVEELILQPLLSRLHGRNAELQLGACRALQEFWSDSPLQKQFGHTLVIPRLKQLLSSDDDEVFIEALRLVIDWHWPGVQHITTPQIQRLIVLLSDNKDCVVERACLCLAQIEAIPLEIAREMVDMGGPQRLMEILFERTKNLDLWDAAEDAIDVFFNDSTTMNSLMEQNIILALAHHVSSDMILHLELDRSLSILIRILTGCASALIYHWNGQPDAKWHPGETIQIILLLMNQSDTLRDGFEEAKVENVLSKYLDECPPMAPERASVETTWQSLRLERERRRGTT